MSIFKLAYIIALQRIISAWKVELVLFLGTLLAVSLMSSGVIFADLLEQAALRHTLLNSKTEDVNFTIRTYTGLDDPKTINGATSNFTNGLGIIENRVTEPLRSYLNGEARIFETLPFFFKGTTTHSKKTGDEVSWDEREKLILSRKSPETANVDLSPLGIKELGGQSNTRPRGRIVSLTGLLTGRSELIDGVWPYARTSSQGWTEGKHLEVVIDEEGRNLTGLSVGTEIQVFSAVNNKSDETMPVKVVGVFRKIDHKDEFWHGMERTFSHKDGQLALVPLFTSDEAILQIVGQYYPGLYTETKWYFFIDTFRLRVADTDYLQEKLRELEEILPRTLKNTSTSIKLDDIIKSYKEETLVARIPLYLMVSLTTGILIYYLTLISGLVIRSRSVETSLLKSRGITTPQMGILALVEGVIIAVPAILIGPLIALTTSQQLGNIFVEIGEGTGNIQAALSSQSLILGMFGALLSVSVLTIYTIISSSKGMVEFRQSGSRPSTKPFLQRTYIDIIGIGVIGVIWWQIQARGSFLVRSIGTGELEIDLSLLLGPLLGLVAIGLIVMRMFPLSVMLLSKIADRTSPVWVVQGLRRISRDPIIPGALVVLLMLTTSLGVVGSTFRSTIERSLMDRALYSAGSDLRFEHGMRRSPVSLLGLANLTRRVDSAETISEVLRTPGTYSTSGLDQVDLSILGVDTGNFSEVAWYRDDLMGNLTLNNISELLTANTKTVNSENLFGQQVSTRIGTFEEGIELPTYSTTLSLWVNPGNMDPSTRVVGRIRDSSGFYFDVLFGFLDFEDFELDSKGWIRLDADLFPTNTRSSWNPPAIRINSSGFPDFAGAIPPFTLQSIRIDIGSTMREPGAIFLGELLVSSPLDYEGTNIGDHINFLNNWHIVDDLDVPGLLAFEYSASVSLPSNREIDPNTRLIGRQQSSEGSAALSWVSGGLALPTIAFGSTEIPLPAIVSNSLLDLANANPGDTLTIGTIDSPVPIRVAGSTDYFPTLDPKKSPFAIVDLSRLNHYTNLRAEKLTGGSNEMWIRMKDGESGEVLAGDLSGTGVILGNILVADEMVSSNIEKPLVNAGWAGLLILMFFSLVLASASGIMLYCYTDSKERHTEYAILRTLGFAKNQLNGVVWFNLILVMIFGIGVGTLAGYQIGTSILPVLEITEQGVRVTPPMTLRLNWNILLLTYLILTTIAVITTLWLSWITNKMDIQSVLRIGDN